MNNQDERFWSEFSEDELKDPTNKRMMAALRDIYHIDEDDRQSVERAWQRISSSIDQEQKQQRLSRLNGRHENPAHFSLVGAKNIAHIQRSSMRRRLDTLVALGIVFLLIGSMLGVLAYRQAMSSNQAGKGTPVSTQNPNTPIAQKRLGISLGEMSLGMTPSFFTKHGIPGRLFPTAKNNSLIFQCSSASCWITFTEDSSLSSIRAMQQDPARAVQQDPSLSSIRAVQIVVERGFQSNTIEGFRLGMSLRTFNMLYKENQFQRATFNIPDFQNLTLQCPLYVPLAGPGTIVSVKDTYGTTLWVVFNHNQQAMQIVLQSSAIKPCTP